MPCFITCDHYLLSVLLCLLMFSLSDNIFYGTTPWWLCTCSGGRDMFIMRQPEIYVHSIIATLQALPRVLSLSVERLGNCKHPWNVDQNHPRPDVTACNQPGPIASFSRWRACFSYFLSYVFKVDLCFTPCCLGSLSLSLCVSLCVSLCLSLCVSLSLSLSLLFPFMRLDLNYNTWRSKDSV